MKEMDQIATTASTNKLDENERMVLDMVRNGAAWNRTAAFWAGQVDDKMCKNCGEDENTPDHIWTCCALKAIREEADPELCQWQ